jgi:hypothetical protein
MLFSLYNLIIVSNSMNYAFRLFVSFETSPMPENFAGVLTISVKSGAP